jgi:hypothetical protein
MPFSTNFMNRIEMKKKLKSLFETKMYLISLIPFLLLMRFSESGDYGINKTVGWAYDLTNFSYFITYILFAFFLLFSFLAIIKAKTNLILSVFFFLCISFCCLFINGYRNIRIIDNILLFSILLFVILFINSIYLKFKNLNKSK